MELRHYLAALHRHWVVWVGATVLGALVGALVVAATPATYEASARVFVSVSPSIPNSAGFVQQRIKSYPDVVASESVLGPVKDDLGLEESLADLRDRVRATNPADTSQVGITVRGRDPQQAAEIADAVAEQLTVVVEQLETPASGNRPVTLTVTDPAATPTSPVAPVALFVIGLGLLVGLFLGLAAAVVRSRVDTAVHTPEDVRRAWGADVEVLTRQPGRAGRSEMAGSPATFLARRLERRAEEGPVRAVLVTPAPGERPAVATLADEVAAALVRRDVEATVAAAAQDDDGARVRLEVADPLAPARVWRERAERGDAVVLVLPAGRVAAAELHEMRAVLDAAGIRPLAVAVVPRHRTRPAASAGPSSAAAGTSTPAAEPSGPAA
ncbi:YveK family protein, partial [Geodermatophilus sp. CPCC 205506]|uniref:YveK family protein n=1 Tax=Geodermatophilus sp. CPCC 205506 TaxID=2936596 RepID=UPI003EEA8046